MREWIPVVAFFIIMVVLIVVLISVSLVFAIRIIITVNIIAPPSTSTRQQCQVVDGSGGLAVVLCWYYGGCYKPCITLLY